MADSQHVTLVASTVNTVALNAEYEHIEVTNVDGVSAVYFTVGGAGNLPATPSVGGIGCLVLGAAVDAHRELDNSYFENGATTVKLISAGTPKVCVRGW